MKKFVSILLTMAMLVTMVPIIAATATVDTAAANTGTWLDEWDLTWYTEVVGKTTVDATATEAADNDGIVYINETSAENSDRIEVNICTEGKTFYIDTAAKLAGLAKICDMENKSYFGGSTIYITADIDLAGHDWYPIAHNKGAYCGSIIGNKGASASNPITDGGAVKISNMTCNFNDDKSVGLVGIFKNGTISNMELVNASITADSWLVGSFVAYQAAGVTEYSNLKSDAVISMPAGKGHAESCFYDNIGGIVGYIGGAYPTNGIKNCTFTGSIDAPAADCVGGIVGNTEVEIGNLVIENCVVVSDCLKYGKENRMQPDANAEWRIGLGGIVGKTQAGNGTNTSYATKISNCYVSANISAYMGTTRVSKDISGFIGNACGKVEFTNCQFDGRISDTAEKTSAFVSRCSGNAGTVKYTNCVNTGVYFNGKNSNGFNNDAFAWTTTHSSLNTDSANNYSIMKERLVIFNGQSETTRITANTEFTGLDFTNTWTKKEGSIYPVLTIAKDLAPASSVVNGGVDLTWMDATATSYTIDSIERFAGFDLVWNALLAFNSSYHTSGGSETDTTFQEAFEAKAKFPMHLAVENMSGISENVKSIVNEQLNVSGGFVNDKIVSMEFVQKAIYANSEGKYNVRLTAKVKGTQYSGITFKYEIKTVSNGATTYGEIVETDAVKTLHTSVIENLGDSQNTITAEEGYYFVVFIIENVDIDNADELSVAARACAKPLEGKPMYSKIAAHTIKAQ